MKKIKKNRKWWALLGIGLSSMIATIDFTIVNTALSSIQKELFASISELQWVMAAYGISFVTLLTIMGRLADLYGRRLLLYIAMGGFLLTSLGAGMSQSILQLIIFRFFQGVFGAIFFPCGIALTSQSFPKEERGRAIGIYGSLLGIGISIGPVLGGFIVSIANWNWIFYINIPVILLSYLFCFLGVSESKAKVKEPLDWWGVLSFIIGFGALIFAIMEGPEYGWFSATIWAILLISALFLSLFYRIEKKAEMPILPMHLMKNRGFFLSITSYISSVSCVWPLLFLLPLYLQYVLGQTPGMTGLIMLAMTVMTIISSGWSGKLYDKKGPYLAILLLYGSIFIGYILQIFFTSSGPLSLILIAFIIFGFGWGIGNGISAPLAISHLPSNENTGMVSGAAITILNAMGVILLAFIGMFFRIGQRAKINNLLKESGIALSENQNEAIKTLIADPAALKNVLSQFSADIAVQIQLFFKKGFMFGFHLSIWILLIMTFLIFLSILQPLKKEK